MCIELLNQSGDRRTMEQLSDLMTGPMGGLVGSTCICKLNQLKPAYRDSLCSVVHIAYACQLSTSFIHSAFISRWLLFFF